MHTYWMIMAEKTRAIPSLDSRDKHNMQSVIIVKIHVMDLQDYNMFGLGTVQSNSLRLCYTCMHLYIDLRFVE